MQEAYKRDLKVGDILPVSVTMNSGTIQLAVDHTGGLVNRIPVCRPHPEAIFYIFRNDAGTGRHMDNAIQVAIDLAGLDIELNSQYLAQLETIHRRTGGDRFHCTSDTVISCLNIVLKFEDEGDARKVDYADLAPPVRQLFTKWSGLAASRANMEEVLWPKCPEWHVSLVKGLHVLMVERSVQARRAMGFPELARAQETHQANNYVHQKAALVRGRETNVERGHPGLVAGRETMKAGGWQALARGRETKALQREAERPAKEAAAAERRAALDTIRAEGLAKREQEEAAKAQREANKDSNPWWNFHATGTAASAAKSQRAAAQRVEEARKAADQSKYCYCPYCVWVTEDRHHALQHYRKKHNSESFPTMAPWTAPAGKGRGRPRKGAIK